MKKIIWKPQLPKTLPAPALLSNLPLHAKWLAGEGAGSWFVLDPESQGNYGITRFSPTGVEECSGSFKVLDDFDPNTAYEVTYPSNCAKVTVLQNDKEIKFMLKKVKI